MLFEREEAEDTALDIAPEVDLAMGRVFRHVHLMHPEGECMDVEFVLATAERLDRWAVIHAPTGDL